jgi:transposase
LENGLIPFHYVGGLRLSQVGTLLTIPLSKYSTLVDDYSKTKEKTKVYRTKMSLYSRNMTILITFDPRLYKKHVHTHEENILKTQVELEALKQQLDKRAVQEVLKGRQMTRESVSKRLKQILSRDHMSEIFTTNIIIRDCPNRPLITFRLNRDVSAEVEKKHFGKRAFYTNQHDWSNEEIVGTYNSAWHVEGVFRQLKDVDYLSVRPLYHWTDQKIKIHIFFCVLAYQLCCILNHELRSNGIEVSINKMLESLSEIRKVITVFGTNDSDIVISLSKGSNIAEKILDLYGLRVKYLS